MGVKVTTALKPSSIPCPRWAWERKFVRNKGGRAPTRTTLIRAYANHGYDDKKRDGRFCANYDYVIHALPVFLPFFRLLRFLKDFYACHGEDRGRGHQTRKPPVAKQWKRFEIDVEASTPTHEVYVRIAWSRSPRWFSRCPRILLALVPESDSHCGEILTSFVKMQKYYRISC